MVMVDEDEYERLRRGKQSAPPASVGPVLTPSLNRAKEDVSEMMKVRNMDAPDTDKADMYERLLTKYFADLRSLTPSARQTATPRTRPDDPMASGNPPHEEPERERLDQSAARGVSAERRDPRTASVLKRGTDRSRSRTPLSRPALARAFRTQGKSRRESDPKPKVPSRQTRSKATPEDQSWEELKRTEVKKTRKRKP